jgi:hypothetical protein
MKFFFPLLFACFVAHGQAFTLSDPSFLATLNRHAAGGLVPPYIGNMVFGFDTTAAGAISGDIVSDKITSSGATAYPVLGFGNACQIATDYLGKPAMYVDGYDGSDDTFCWYQSDLYTLSSSAANIDFTATKGCFAWKAYLVPGQELGDGPYLNDASDGSGTSCLGFVRDDYNGNWVITDSQLVTGTQEISGNSFDPVITVPQDNFYHWFIFQWDLDAGTWSFYIDNNYGFVYFYQDASSIGVAQTCIIGRSATTYTQKFYYYQGINLTPTDVTNLVNNF